METTLENRNCYFKCVTAACKSKLVKAQSEEVLTDFSTYVHVGVATKTSSFLDKSGPFNFTTSNAAPCN